MAHSGMMVELIMKVVLALGVVLVIVGLASWLVKRTGWGGASRKRSFLGPEVISTTHLAPRQALHLVRVGDEVVLIGATREQISSLGRFACPAEPRRESAPEVPAGTTTDDAGGRMRNTPASFLDYVEAALRGGQIHPGRTSRRGRSDASEPETVGVPSARK